MARIKFFEDDQRKFFDEVILKMNSPSLRGLLQFGFKVKYSTLKNYYSGVRLLPEDLFIDFCNLSGIDKSNLRFELVKENWGKVIGGKKSRRGKV